jgi:hypothetical protein
MNRTHCPDAAVLGTIHLQGLIYIAYQPECRASNLIGIKADLYKSAEGWTDFRDLRVAQINVAITRRHRRHATLRG